MTKSLVTKLFVASIVAVVAGLVLGLAAVVAGYSGNAFVLDGPDVVGVEQTPFAVLMVVLAVAGVLAMVGGVVVGFVAWIAALVNTIELEDKTWFVVLLALGLLSFGFIAMLLYVIAGPDGARRQLRTDPHPA
jgi:hypothetical protein